MKFFLLVFFATNLSICKICAQDTNPIISPKELVGFWTTYGAQGQTPGYVIYEFRKNGEYVCSAVIAPAIASKSAQANDFIPPGMGAVYRGSYSVSGDKIVVRYFDGTAMKEEIVSFRLDGAAESRYLMLNFPEPSGQQFYFKLKEMIQP